VLATRVFERNLLAYRRMWLVFLTGFVEPFMFLLSIGIGVGHLVGKVPAAGGHAVSYRVFVAPGLLASAAMNGAVFDTTFNFFFKFKYARTFDAMLATPLSPGDVAVGELGWAQARGTIYAAAFLATMWGFGLVPSAWGVVALPGAMLIGLGFAGLGMGATTFMRSFVDFDYVNIALVPLFLFSATFFPLDRYPGALRVIVRATPLYQGAAMERALVLGHPNAATIAHAVYLAVMGAAGLRIAGTRLKLLLQP
jgi:lipooligosaccharide transport system permease protein